MIRWLEVGFTLFIMLVAGYVILEASAWQLQARLFPWVVGFPLLALSGVYLVRTLRTRPAEVPGESLAQAIGFWNPTARRETLRLVAWIGVFLVCITLFSMILGISLGLLLYLKLESKERWPLSVGLAATSFAYMYLLFDVAMHVAWPEGVVSSLLSSALLGR